MVNRGSPRNCLLRLRDPGKHGKLGMSSYRWASRFSPEAKLTNDSWRERDFTFAPSRAWAQIRGGSLRFINDKCLERDLVFVSPGGRSTLVFDSVRLLGVGVRPSSCPIFSVRALASLVSTSSVVSSRIT